jgi:hypothetical protein
MNDLSLTYNDFEAMYGIDVSRLVAARLDDIANQYEKLRDRGDDASADLLKQEGLMLADSFDADEPLLFAQVIRRIH